MPEARLRSSRATPPADVVGARSSDGFIFLDITHDSYSCLYAPRADGARSDPADLMSMLRAQGVADAALAKPSASGAPRAWRDMPEADAPVLRAKDLARFALALARTALAFRRCSFAQLLGRPSSWTAPAETIDPDLVVAAVRRFTRLSVWLPFRMRCLFRSLFLLEFLRAYGLRADWVFGAILFPFNAHCWVAAGDLLLGEEAARVDRLSILLVKRARA